ncbi:hypothetical protein HYALB_00005932 [Hymenoscyphus albidus]|uniref:Uncharacterized protein n=1 Tax=Hymenoscyphus albidus TaxID=595503 RepID=A0A9N9Q8X3_9HELO|nr:hypothetical protein HYALB_00005932 [Hymenoscyphus albidus]
MQNFPKKEHPVEGSKEIWLQIKKQGENNYRSNLQGNEARLFYLVMRDNKTEHKATDAFAYTSLKAENFIILRRKP